VKSNAVLGLTQTVSSWLWQISQSQPCGAVARLAQKLLATLALMFLSSESATAHLVLTGPTNPTKI
jgi:hypothetical protein